MSDRNDELTKLGRGVVEANRRLTRVLQLLEGQRPEPQGPAHLDTLLDLLDALHAASRDLPEAHAEGLRLAQASAERSLAAQGIVAITTEGLHDPSLHHALDTLSAPSADLVGHLAATHRRGWRRLNEPGVLRFAAVTVYGESS